MDRPSAIEGQRPELRAILASVFFFSGTASLIFQVVWQRLLTVHYGVGPISSTLIVSVYMLGLGLGSLLGGAIADRTHHRVAVYLAVEVGLGVFGLLSLPYLDILGRYTAGSDYWVSLACMVAFLSLPTLAMGMTLPLIVKIFNQAANDFLDTVSFLYFVNTLGAAFGAFFASYVLISFLGLDGAAWVAAGLDFAIAATIFLAQRARATDQPSAAQPARTQPEAQAGGLHHLAYLCVFLTGFLAIAFEIVWFRLLEVLVKASAYAFSSVLAVFLLGIALGSYGMHRWLAHRPDLDRRSLFFLLQAGIGAFVLVSVAVYYQLTKHTPLGVLTLVSFSTDIHPSLTWPAAFTAAELLKLFPAFDIVAWPLYFVFMPTLLMGASFPLVSFLALSEPEHEGRTVGRIYFFNTVGNMLGGVVTGFVLLPVLGTEQTLLALGLTAVSLGLFVTRFQTRPIPLMRRVATCLAVTAVALLLFPRAGELYAAIHRPAGEGWRTYMREGIDGVVVTHERGEVVRNFINGLGHGGRPGYKYYQETAEAAAYTREARDVLVIGFGTGSIVEAVLKLPGVRKVTLVELNRTLMANLGQMPVFQTILADPRLEVVADDGRRFLLRTTEAYDMILIDPLRTTTAYSNNMYSRQFFALAGRHLREGGVFMAWMDEHRVMPRTVAAAFPHVRFYGFYCLAANTPMAERPARREALLRAFPPKQRARIEAAQAPFLGDATTMDALTAGYPVNEDWRPVCEYFIGLNIRKRLREPG